jgi:hypothetical protein
MADLSFIFGSLLILSLYAFHMSFAEEWAFGNPRKARKQSKKGSPEFTEVTEIAAEPTHSVSDEATTSIDNWTTIYQRSPQWVQNLPRVTAGLAAGGCLMVIVVIVGAVAFGLFYLLTDQPDRVSQILPRFAYWFPFALLGMVTNSPFQIVYWEDRRIRVLLRLVIFWFPRLVIIAFVINPSFLGDLDPAITALTVLAIDAVLAAFCLGLYTAREQMGKQGV